MKLLSLILFSSLAFSQTPPPANLTVAEQVTTPNLGSVLNWGTVVGATYNVYRSPNYDCSGTLHLVRIATALNSTNYTDNPTPALALGGECYAVTSVIAGVESGYSNMVSDFLGDKLYVTLRYDNNTGIGGATVVLKQNGVQVLSLVTNSGGSIVKIIRLFSGDTYEFDITLADGVTHFTFPDPGFGDAEPVVGIESSFNTVTLHKADNTVSTYVVQLTMQPTI